MNFRNKTKGFTFIEMAIAIAIIGILLGSGLPIARVYIDQYKHTQDRVYISQLKELLIGYMLARGGLPDDTGNVIPINNIGMTGINAYAGQIRYYANPLLTEATTTNDLTTLCDMARDIVVGITASTIPAICNEVTDTYTDCTNSTVMAFVIVSSGANRAMEHENGDADFEFENPSKKPNSTNDYDDIVASYGLPQLINECRSS